MSRAIKFRAWDGRSIRYDVTGFEHGRDNEMVCVFLNGDCYAIGDRSSQHPNAEVMQFTGLTDRNGVESYEGDIVTADDILCVVEWQKAEWTAAWSSVVRGAGRQWRHPQLGFRVHEVIGNIYENSELLEAKP